MITSFKRAKKLPGADDAFKARGRNQDRAAPRGRRSFKSYKYKAREKAREQIPLPIPKQDPSPIPKQDHHKANNVHKEPHATDVHTQDHYAYHVDEEIHDYHHQEDHHDHYDADKEHHDDDYGHHGHYDANHFDPHEHHDTEHHAPVHKEKDLHHDLHEDDEDHHEDLDHDHDEFHDEYDHGSKDHMDDHLGLYDMGFSAATIDGKHISLDLYKGKVTLFVNVASQCGYTEENYRILQAVYDKYKNSGLEIVAFPCNDFGNQEPLHNWEIAEFARNHSASFQMMAKIAGINSSPIFTWLRAHSPNIAGSNVPVGAEIDWNFNKFLVDKHGHVANRYASGIDQGALEHDVYDLLMIPYEEKTHVEHH